MIPKYVDVIRDCITKYKNEVAGMIDGKNYEAAAVELGAMHYSVVHATRGMILEGMAIHFVQLSALFKVLAEACIKEDAMDFEIQTSYLKEKKGCLEEKISEVESVFAADFPETSKTI